LRDATLGSSPFTTPLQLLALLKSRTFVDFVSRRSVKSDHHYAIKLLGSHRRDKTVTYVITHGTGHPSEWISVAPATPAYSSDSFAA
jgi:hypothetical protein